MENTIIMKFDYQSEYALAGISCIRGLVKAKQLLPVIDIFDKAPIRRPSGIREKVQAAEDAMSQCPELFPLSTEGILLATTAYQRLERNRIGIREDGFLGIIEGQYVLVALGIYVLKKVFESAEKEFPEHFKDSTEFKKLWNENKEAVEKYLSDIKENSKLPDATNFYIPVELYCPEDKEKALSEKEFTKLIKDITFTRNPGPGAQFHDYYKQWCLEYISGVIKDSDSELYGTTRMDDEDKSKGTIPLSDLIGLACMPLTKIEPLKDKNGAVIELPVLDEIWRYWRFGEDDFINIMKSKDASEFDEDAKKGRVINAELDSVIRLIPELARLYEKLHFEVVKEINGKKDEYSKESSNLKRIIEKETGRESPVFGAAVDLNIPTDFVFPLYCGLSILLVKTEKDGKSEICWRENPDEFLDKNLPAIMPKYMKLLSICDFERFTAGRSSGIYEQVCDYFKMALAGIL